MDANLSQAIAALTDPDPTVRSQAAEQLSRLGPDAQPAAVALVQVCGDESEEVREWAAAALEELGPPTAADVDTLATLLVADNADVGYWAATLLGRLGPDAAPVIAALATAVAESRHQSVRQRAAWALGQIGPSAEAAIGALKQAAASSDVRLARLAQRALDPRSVASPADCYWGPVALSGILLRAASMPRA